MEPENENLLIGLFIAIVFIGMALLHMRENARLEKKLQEKLEPDLARWLMRFAWSRTMQLLCALGACIVMFMNYDKALTETRESLDKLTHIVEQRAQEDAKKQQTQAAASPATPAPQPAAAAAAIAPASAAAPAQSLTPPPGDENAINKALQLPLNMRNSVPDEPPGTEKVIIANVSESPAGAADGDTTLEAADSDFSYNSDATPDSEPPSRNETIEALYNPERDQQDIQSGMDDIKKRYEDILVIHQFLRKCNKVPPEGIHIISTAISQEIQALQAPANLQESVMESARSSYREIYARSPCNGKGINSLVTQYNDYLAVLQKNFQQQ